MPSRSDRGFTLIELIVVLALAGLTAALAIPSFTDALDRRRVRLAAEVLREDLDHARLEAAASGQDVRVVPLPHFRGWAGGWAASRGHLPIWASSSGPLHARVRSSHTRPSIVFAADGGTATNQTVTFCIRGKRGSAMSVIVAAAGRVRIEPARDEHAERCSR